MNKKVTVTSVTDKILSLKITIGKKYSMCLNVKIYE